MTANTPEYDRAYYQGYFGVGDVIPYERNDHWLRFFGEVADQIVQRLHPASAFDAGCAMGFLVEALHARGVDASGLDTSEYAIGEAHHTIADRVRVGTLTEPIGGSFDLITCIEVIEHLPAADAPVALKNLADATDRLLLSTTPSEYSEPTHLNVQPPEYWAGVLADFGMYRVHDFDASFLTPWAVLFERREPRTADVVAAYERERWHLVQERDALRQALLAANVSDIQEPTGDAATIAQLRNDLRVAIDAAHAADARRASVESRLAHVEYALDVAKAREGQVEDLVAEIDELAGGDIAALLAEHRQHEELIESRSFKAIWKLLTPYRRLRGGQ